MTSRITSTGLAAVLALSGAAPAWGQLQLQAVTLFAYGGGYSAVHQVFNLQTGSTDDFKLGFDVGGGIGLQLHRYLEVRATLTGAQSHLRVNGGDTTTTYLNRYYVGADVKLHYPFQGGLTPYALGGGGMVMLHQKGTAGGDKSQGFGHLGLGFAYAFRHPWSVFVEGDAFFYSLSGLTAGTLSNYHSAQFDSGWSVGLSYRFAL